MQRFLLLLLPAFIISCASGVEQYRTGIETLGIQWDSTTAMATELANNISGSLSEYSTSASALQVSNEVMAKLKPGQTEAWDAAKSAFNQALQGFAPLRTELGEFVNAWGAEGSKVQALKDGLAAGSLEGDVAGQLGELNTLIAQAGEKLPAWTAQYEQAKTTADEALKTLKSAHDAVIAAVPGK
jgi:hypothetical protein